MERMDEPGMVYCTGSAGCQCCPPYDYCSVLIPLLRHAGLTELGGCDGTPRMCRLCTPPGQCQYVCQPAGGAGPVGPPAHRASASLDGEGYTGSQRRSPSRVSRVSDRCQALETRPGVGYVCNAAEAQWSPGTEHCPALSRVRRCVTHCKSITTERAVLSDNGSNQTAEEPASGASPRAAACAGVSGGLERRSLRFACRSCDFSRSSAPLPRGAAGVTGRHRAAASRFSQTGQPSILAD